MFLNWLTLAIQAVWKANLTPIIWGPPGVGKTALVEKLSHNHGEKIIMSTLEPSDFTGLPVRIDHPDGLWSTEFATPGWALRAIRSEPSRDYIIFFDEISSTVPSMQSAALTLIQSRHLPNGVSFPDHVKFIAAANPPDIATNGYELSSALTNRLVHFPWDMTNYFQDWLAGFSMKWGKKITPEEESSRSLIAGFLTDNPALAYAYPVNDAPESDRGWPSYRSWDNLATALSFCDSTAVEYLITEGIVGVPAARQFHAWKDGFILPDLADLFADPSIHQWKKHPGHDYALVNKVILSTTKSNYQKVIPLLEYARDHSYGSTVVAHGSKLIEVLVSFGVDISRVFSIAGTELVSQASGQ